MLRVTESVFLLKAPFCGKAVCVRNDELSW